MDKTSKNMLSKSVNFSIGEKLPSSVYDGGIASYISMVKTIPHLSQEEEYDLAIKVQKYHDLDAAEKLIKSNLFLVIATAYEYKGYGLPISDIISEGNIGLMKAVKKFNPSKGFKLSTYALWWIRATINEFILSSWSLVKIGTKSAQRKLFFSLRKIKAKLGIYHDSDLTLEEANNVANLIDVDKEEVIEMNRRIVKDSSLNKMAKDDEHSTEVINLISSDTPNSEDLLMEEEIKSLRNQMLKNAISKLNTREQEILTARRLQEPSATLDELATKLNISKERVRQIENKAIEKLSIILLDEKNKIFGLN